MSEVVTMALARRSRPQGIVPRLLWALRAYWSGSFTLKDPALNRLYGVSTRSAAGPVVDEHTMFTCSAVYDAVNQIASDVAKLPLHLKKRRAGGGTDDFVDSRLFRLLKHSPNPETRSMVFRRTLTAHALIGKGGFAEIERDNVGQPIALWIIEPHRVEPFYDEAPSAGRRRPLRYKIDGGKVVLESRDVLHLQGLGWSSVQGMEMVAVAREAIGLSLASQQFAASFFGNGTRFGGVLSSDQDLDDGQKQDIREAIEAMHAKADKAFRLLVLGAGFKFQETGVRPNDAQMREVRDQQVQEIARFFNLPLHKLKQALPGVMSYASVEMADLDYYKGCILNWITLWEQELNAKLIPPLEQNQQFWKHNVNGFLRADTKARSEFYAAMLDRGVFNADTVLELEDMNPQPNGQGQLFLVQGAMVPKNLIAPQIEAKIALTTAKAETPPASPPSPSSPDDDDDEAIEAERARTAAAEALAQEALTRADEETRRRIAAEATQTATAEEVQLRRQAEDAARAHATACELAAETLRMELQQREAQRAAAERARLEMAEQLAETERVAAETRATLEASRTDADNRIRALQEEIATDLAMCSHWQNEAARAEQTAQETAGQLSEVTARSQAETEALIAAHQQAEARASGLQEDVARHAARCQELEQAVAALDTKYRDFRLSFLAALRQLLVDAVGRMTRRECQQARAKQATPEKLRAWLTGFATLEEEVCTQALQPIIAAHLTWRQSTADPVEMTAALVREHLRAFRAQLDLALESDPTDFHAVLNRVLSRWETERAASVADAWLTEEIRYVA